MLINDIKINVYEIAWLTEAEISRFHSDFRIVANSFSKKRRNKRYIPDDKTELVHVDAVLKLLSVMTGDNSYEEILTAKAEDNEAEEVRNMCDVAQRLIDQGKKEGRAEGRAEERQEILTQLLQAGMDPDEIAIICNIDPLYVRNLKEEMSKTK